MPTRRTKRVRPMPACTTAIVLVPAEAACAIAGCVPTAAADRSLGGVAGEERTISL